MIVPFVALAILHQQALKLPNLFSDNMVLQRETNVPFFGKANPGDTVTVQLVNQSVQTTAGPDGKWNLKLQPLKAGGPFTALVQTPTNTITYKNVMVGEVWLCSGQSNMEMPESLADDFAKAQDEANPAIRIFDVGQVSMEKAAEDVRGSWVPESKDSIGDYSAVAIAFGRELHDKLNVPIGLIQATWGGTKAEAWTSREALSADPALGRLVSDYLASLHDFTERNAEFKAQLKEWVSARADSGNEGFLKGWENRLFDDSQWAKAELPNTLDTIEPVDDGKGLNGAVWFRKGFIVPDAWAGKPLKLQLGTIADYDDTYVNGTKVGRTKLEAADPAKVNRSYRVAPGILLQGVNTIAVRIYSAQGSSGFTGRPDQMKVTLADGSSEDAIMISGEWREKVERKVDTSQTAPHMPFGPGNPNVPGGLFNGMIAPLIPYGIKGAIWYQGEADAGNARQYRTLFPALIRDWRRRWSEAEFPFFFVQLANFHVRQDLPTDSDWAEIREAQVAALKLSETGMVTAIDIGQADTIHPKNKREVGRRLALVALSKEYKQHESWSGPELNYVTPNSGTLRVFFKHVEDGLKTSDGKLPRGFQIAGDDRHFYWADAKIEGSAIVLSNPNVPNPVSARYAWADNPDVNLYNSADLPAIPFRTDNWPRSKT